MRIIVVIIATVLSLLSVGSTSSQAVTIIPAKPNYQPRVTQYEYELQAEWETYQRHYDNAVDMFDLYYQAVDPNEVTAIMEFNRLYSRVGVIEHIDGSLLTFPTQPMKMKRVNGKFVSHNLLIARGE
jgi:hypothetical protein